MLLSILNSQKISRLDENTNAACKMIPIRGFTLSEVLITIGIIGVVSSLVIPTLFQTIKDKELVSQYLKSHTVLTNAYKETEAVEGYKLYQLPETEFREKYEQHLRTVPCEEYDVCLADGTGFDYEIDENENISYILVDTNGIKKPNSPGKDLYKFKVTKDGLISESESQEYCFGYDCGKYVLTYHKIYDGLISNCLDYENGYCTGCQDGYRLENHICTAVNTSNCLAYNGENCKTCNSGYHVKSGTCSMNPSYCVTVSDGGATCTLSDGTTAIKATVSGKDVYVSYINREVNWYTAMNIACPTGTSLADLNTLKALRGQPGMPTGGWIWSSSERNSGYAYQLNFGNGSIDDGDKRHAYRLLCVGDAE